MITEFCKRHKVDHTGTYCGFCVEIWKRDSAKLKLINKRLDFAMLAFKEALVSKKKKRPN